MKSCFNALTLLKWEVKASAATVTNITPMDSKTLSEFVFMVTK